jgi:membrane protein required for colicin V production
MLKSRVTASDHRWMSWVDYFILGILALSILVGLLRGFVREVLGLATWVSAFVAAHFLGEMLAAPLVPYIPGREVRLVASYTLVFFAALFVGSLVTHLIGSLVRDGAIAGIDRTMGAGYGLLRGVAVVVIVIMLSSVTAARENRWWRESVLIPPLVPLADTVRSWIPERWLAPWQAIPAQQSAVRSAGGS